MAAGGDLPIPWSRRADQGPRKETWVRATYILSPGLICLPLPRKLSLRRKQLGEVDLLLVAIADVADGAGLLIHKLNLGLVAPAVHGVGAPAEISHLPVLWKELRKAEIRKSVYVV